MENLSKLRQRLKALQLSLPSSGLAGRTTMQPDLVSPVLIDFEHMHDSRPCRRTPLLACQSRAYTTLPGPCSITHTSLQLTLQASLLLVCPLQSRRHLADLGLVHLW